MTRRLAPAPAPSVLSRAVVEAAAVARADRDGLATLSLRHLADDLDVTPMALYRHVGGKDDLLEAVADARLAALGIPSRRKGWPRFLFELAQSLRELFQIDPELLTLFTRRAVTSPAAQARLTAAVQVLERAGFDDHAAIEAYAAVHTYTIGFCALEAGRHEHAHDARAVVSADAIPADSVVATITGFVSDRQFDVGLRAMLAGVAPAAS